LSKKSRKAKKFDKAKGLKREELWYRQLQRLRDFIDMLQKEMDND